MKKRHFCILNSEIKYYYHESDIIIFNMKCLKKKELSKNLVSTTLQTRKIITKKLGDDNLYFECLVSN